MDNLLTSLSQLLQNQVWLAPLLALTAGMLTSFMPCSLATVPIIVAYVGGAGAKDAKKAFAYSLLFALGSALTFTALGMVVSLAGGMIGHGEKWTHIALGALSLLMALQLWGVWNIVPSAALFAKNKRRGNLGAFIAGMLGGVFSSHCATPVLVVLLAIVAERGSVLWGAVLLVCYGAGHGVLSVLAGTSIGLVNKLLLNEKYQRASTAVRILLGALVLALGLYLLYLGL